jgi:hypothetical protein
LRHYRSAILKKANGKANNFRGLERTMPSAGKRQQVVPLMLHVSYLSQEEQSPRA